MISVGEVVILMKKCTKPKAIPREADEGLHIALYVTLTLTSGTIPEYNDFSSHCYKTLDKLRYAFTNKSPSLSW